MMGNKEIKFWYWFVRKLPKKILYFCSMQVILHSTSGKYSGTIVPELTGMEAVKRFGNDFKV